MQFIKTEKETICAWVCVSATLVVHTGWLKHATKPKPPSLDATVAKLMGSIVMKPEWVRLMLLDQKSRWQLFLMHRMAQSVPKP